jgi:hypothetical protein
VTRPTAQQVAAIKRHGSSGITTLPDVEFLFVAGSAADNSQPLTAELRD